MLRKISGLITRSLAVFGHRNVCNAGAGKAARDTSLARLWLFARLAFARTNRMGTGTKSRANLLVWRPPAFTGGAGRVAASAPIGNVWNCGR